MGTKRKWSASQRRYFIDANFDLYNDMEKWGDCAIGFDLGLRNTGYFVVDLDDGNFCSKGTIETRRKKDGTQSERLHKIYDAMKQILVKHNTQIVGYEAIRVKKQLGSFQTLSQVLSCFQIARYFVNKATFSLSLTPTQIKVAAGQDTTADKSKVIRSIESQYDSEVNEHEADAASIAKVGYHLHKVSPCYQSVRNMKIGDDSDLYNFLLDIDKRRQKLFESSVSEYNTDCINTLFGAFSGKSGVRTLTRNSIPRYYQARDKAKELYGD